MENVLYSYVLYSREGTDALTIGTKEKYYEDAKQYNTEVIASSESIMDLGWIKDKLYDQ